MSKTKITNKRLYELRNTSDVFSRLIVMGMLKILNKKLTYQQVWEDSEDGIQDVTIPFFFDFSGGATTSEKFIQDNYQHFTDEECTSIGIKKFDGDFKPIPYGVITLESTTIESSSISNRFVMGQYQKKVGDELKSFVSFLYSIPLTMNFSVNIVCDTINTMWKIEQAYREFFYKHKTFRVNYKGTVVHARVGFPESLASTKTSTYTFGNTSDTTDIKLNFSLTCETYQPVFDPYNETESEHNIKVIGGDITPMQHSSIAGVNSEILNNINSTSSSNISTPINNSSGNNINSASSSNTSTPINNSSEDVYKNIIPEKITATKVATGEDLLIEWDFSYDSNDLLTVDILYKEKGKDDNYVILDTVANHNRYYLNFSEEFVTPNNDIFDVILANSDDAIIVNQPKIKIFPDITTGVVNKDSFTIIDKGFIITEKEYIDAVVCVEQFGKLEDYVIKLHIINNAIDETDPVELEPFAYTGELKYKEVQLFIRDRFHTDKIYKFQDDDKWLIVY